MSQLSSILSQARSKNAASSSSSEQNTGECSPDGSSSSLDEKAIIALEVMLREHDKDSVITQSFLPNVRSRYHISTEYDLHVLDTDQRPFDLFSNGFSLPVDTFEVGLRLSLHPLVVGGHHGLANCSGSQLRPRPPTRRRLDDARASTRGRPAVGCPQGLPPIEATARRRPPTGSTDCRAPAGAAVARG
ncbi:hypothetical protein B296_00022275 [Ensete ventricosum]|uniref:Uncharacterized protein n=1 Tax=Ensete ventricosum TaxID=4639 RepID=A0A426YCR4_ENSVE|nr:hypothetical protein B296_00022275 [Ensete ventricosum]